MTRARGISLQLVHDSDCFWSLIAVIVAGGLAYGLVRVVTEVFSLLIGQVASVDHDPADVGFGFIDKSVYMRIRHEDNEIQLWHDHR